jgi:hypothetical protein
MEEDLATSHGGLGRRYSGRKAAQGDHFQRLLDHGVTPCVVGASPFAFPALIRDLARAGLPNLLIVDLVNAYPTIIHRRHPSLRAVAQYVSNRHEALEAV